MLLWVWGGTFLVGRGPLKQPDSGAEIRLIRDRLRTHLLEHSRFKSQFVSASQEWLKTQQEDGSWEEIPYVSPKGVDGWPARDHLIRLSYLAFAWAKTGHPLHKSETAIQAISRGLRYWYQVNPVNDNWWQNEIGKQIQLGMVGLLAGPELPEDLLHKLINDLSPAPARTGANRTWISQSAIYRGVLEESPERIMAGVEGIRETIRITEEEGVQADWSFHQHGPQLYSAGYGIVFLDVASHWAFILRETSFAFSQMQLEILTNLLLEGHQWMVRYTYMDHSADGREIVRPGQYRQALQLVPVIDRMIEAYPRREEPLAEFMGHILEGEPPVVWGHRHFWRSDYATHQELNYFASVKMVSNRTWGTETGNGENPLGCWLPFGMTFICPQGDEYADIFPVWDWKCLPGVTNPQRIYPMEDWKGVSQPATFVGGLAQGQFGLNAMVLDTFETRAKKSWFFFGEEIVCLGAGISSTDSVVVITTLNQCLADQPLVGGKPLKEGPEEKIKGNWAWNGGVGYVFDPRQEIYVRSMKQSGNWKRIKASLPDTMVQKQVFSLWLDHGVNPENAAYQYILLPGQNESLTRDYAKSPAVQILENRPEVQAVTHPVKQQTGIVFFQPGAIEIRPGLSVKVNAPCMVWVEEIGNIPQVSLASPEPDVKSVVIELAGESDTYKHTFVLRQGAYLGRAVRHLF